MTTVAAFSGSNQGSPDPVMPDLGNIKSRQQATWASGDFAVIGVTLQIVGESLAEAIADGPAQQAGIREGDVVLKINNQWVENAAKFRELVDDLPAGRSVAVLVQRSSGPLFLALRVPE